MAKGKRKSPQGRKKKANSVPVKENIEVEVTKQGVQEMNESKKFYFKESFVNELLKDSYQNYLVKIQEYVNVEKKKIFSENYDGGTHVFGTFKNHAIVSDDFGNLKRLHLENDSKEIRCNKVEEVKIKKYTQEEVEAELSGDLAKELRNTLDCKEGEDCDQSFQESFNHLVNFSTTNNAKGFINILE